MNNNTEQLIIIGSGPAGLTASVYASRANLEPLVVEGSAPGGQLMGTTVVENWPGEKSIMGPKLMMQMREHAKHFGTRFESGNVTKVDFTQKPFTLWTDRGKELKAHSVIVATGAIPNRLGCPGEDEYWGRGVTTCAVCDGAFYPDKKVVVVGGGDTAMEDSSFLTKFTKDVTVIQILDKLTASAAMQKRVLEHKDIDVIYNSTVTQIKGDGEHVTSMLVTNQKTSEKTEMPVDGIFIAIGLSPNTKIFEGQLALGKFGYMEVKNHTKTSVEGVFAAGDVGDWRYRQAVTSAGSGCMAALDAERYLASVLD